jgi:hypothetical protein
MLDNSHFSKGNEKFVLNIIQDAPLKSRLKIRKNMSLLIIFILHPACEPELENWSLSEAGIEIADFRDA